MQKRNHILVWKQLFMGERTVQGTLLTERKSKVKMSHHTREKARFTDQETRSLNLVFNVQRFMSISRDSQRERSRVLTRASLVAQWLRICLPMQGTWVRALVWEDPTCRGATRPVSHNC